MHRAHNRFGFQRCSRTTMPQCGATTHLAWSSWHVSNCGAAQKLPLEPSEPGAELLHSEFQQLTQQDAGNTPIKLGSTSGVDKQADGGVRPRGEGPGLRGVEGHIQHPPEVHHLVPPQDLDCRDARHGSGEGRRETRSYLGTESESRWCQARARPLASPMQHTQRRAHTPAPASPPPSCHCRRHSQQNAVAALPHLAR